MVVGPATFTVLLVVGLMLMVGALVLASGRKKEARRRARTLCPQCRNRNRTGARFCAHCGHALDEEQCC